ncbi:hypothetical protein [Cobetia amphilecti]|uniref:hypothetical protein n=1 Tax=Cobetia amphilecti TaxID=1055104 RepID=UPI0024493E34|nr:hypothetical protein [Cobetia litoralis]MDH2420631.1 hypothetical protein [Cobetia litoralis]
MQSIASQFLGLKRDYDRDGVPLVEVREIVSYCIELLFSSTSIESYGILDDKEYVVFTSGENKSRPVRKSIFYPSPEIFQNQWDLLVKELSRGDLNLELKSDDINATLYTAIMSFSACFDIWKSKSRKTPGTFFEIILGSLLTLVLPDHKRGKHIALPSFGEQVTTDIVFDNGSSGLAIPVKITTRERVVQPYAQQRILDSVFGVGRYKSVLLCVSETQRDDTKKGVNNICVPGTLKLYQAHLSSLSGLYYLDPPLRYLNPDVTDLVPVGDYGDFFKYELKKLLSS